MAKQEKKQDHERSEQPAGIRKGRFASSMDPTFARFNASVSFDKRLYADDIAGSIAHVKMLGTQGIISPKDARTIERGLTEVLIDIEKGRLEFREDLEDVHINVEEALKAKIGEVAGKLHTARSRNDQVALDLRLYLREQVELVRIDLLALMAALTDKSEENIDLIMPGYTHLQRAQPVRLSHHLMAYFEMLRRDWMRFTDTLRRTDEMPLGSAALAGTTFPIDREAVGTHSWILAAHCQFHGRRVRQGFCGGIPVRYVHGNDAFVQAGGGADSLVLLRVRVLYAPRRVLFGFEHYAAKKES